MYRSMHVNNVHVEKRSQHTKIEKKKTAREISFGAVVGVCRTANGACVKKNLHRLSIRTKFLSRKIVEEKSTQTASHIYSLSQRYRRTHTDTHTQIRHIHAHSSAGSDIQKYKRIDFWAWGEKEIQAGA